jgi:hypothetical protein
VFILHPFGAPKSSSVSPGDRVCYELGISLARLPSLSRSWSVPLAEVPWTELGYRFLVWPLKGLLQLFSAGFLSHWLNSKDSENHRGDRTTVQCPWITGLALITVLHIPQSYGCILDCGKNTTLVLDRILEILRSFVVTVSLSWPRALFPSFLLGHKERDE